MATLVPTPSRFKFIPKRITKNVLQILFMLLLVLSLGTYVRFKSTALFKERERIVVVQHMTKKPPENINHPAPSQNVTCHIPLLNPFDSTIRKFYRKMEPIKCTFKQKPLTFVDDEGYLRFTKIGLKDVKQALVNCFYAEIVRHQFNKADTFKILTFKQFKSAIKINHTDFVKVICRKGDKHIFYTNLHMHIRDIPMKSGAAITKGTKYNVLMYAFDSLSRSNALRQLPKSYHYLQNNLHGFVMKGYNKIGSNSFPNAVGLLTGYDAFKKPYAFFPTDQERKPYDPWPLIWKNFSGNGYRTMFAEDEPYYNIFHYKRAGFKDQPTDHYARTFWKAIEGDTPTSSYCFGGYVKHKMHTNYVRRLVHKLHGKQPFWAFSFLTHISHGKVNTVGMADEDTLKFIEYIHDKGYLNDTFFFMFSDHGERYDIIRQTFVGEIEDKMPLFSMYIPDRFRTEHSYAVRNLEINQMRHTTHFDFYCTLMDILQLGLNSSHVVGNIRTKHGMSLFGEIPSNRTCHSAGVDGEFCTCYEEKVLGTNESYVLIGANKLLDMINHKLISKYPLYKPCTKLKLKSVREARLRIDRKQSTKFFKVIIETSPNDGLYETVIKIAESNDPKTIEVMDTIERLNRYGNQGRCTDEKALERFCYCIN